MSYYYRRRNCGSALIKATRTFAVILLVYAATRTARELKFTNTSLVVADHLDVTVHSNQSFVRFANSTIVAGDDDDDDDVSPLSNQNHARNKHETTDAATINNSSFDHDTSSNATTHTNSTNTFIHAITYGGMRTASTLQFNAVCVSLFLHTLSVRPSLANHTLCNFDYKHLLQNANIPQVVKSHDKPPHNTLLNSTWLFATVKTKQQAKEKREQMKHEYNTPRIGYIQDLETLSEIGVDGIIREYANIFELLPGQIDIMMEYFNIWDKLRICCGLQMSNYWRNELLPTNSSKKDINMKNHSLCPTLDIDATERQFMETRLYKLMDQYERMRYINRPSLVDGILNGTYCSRYNEEVRKTGVGFNKGGDRRYFMEGKNPFETFGIAN